MDQQAREFYELRFRAQFLESKGSAFQDLFVATMSRAHPGDFIPCRPWGRIGDRKNDGYLKSERTLFQVYAPNELKVRQAIRKIEIDFNGALPYWRDYFDTWVFVHNCPDGLAPEVVAKLLELERLHPIKVTHWSFAELVLRFRLLSHEALRSLYGSPPPPEVRKQAHKRARRGQELVREGKVSEAIEEMREALVLAREEEDEAEEVEILAGLALLSSERRGRGNGKYYLQEAGKIIAKSKSTASKVIYLRARAAILIEDGDFAGVEDSYRAALHACCTEPEDEKGNLAIQGCIVRSSLVHFFCNQNRPDEAHQLLVECEEYARQNKAEEDGELFQAALEAGIHYSLTINEEDAAINRIVELEGFAGTSRMADRIGGALLNIANHAAHRKFYRAALAAAEASIRLARRCGDVSPTLLRGALYAEAMVLAKAGEDEAAFRKAEAILDLCHGPDDEIIKSAVHHLIAELRRWSGDSQAAVELARQALSAVKGRPEDIAFSKLALARALNDNGETEEALKQAREGWVLAQPAKIPPEARLDVISHITNYASQLGAKVDLAEALVELGKLGDSNEEVKAGKQHAVARASANLQLRARFLKVFEEDEPAKVAQTEDCRSLAEANAAVVRPLLRLWKHAPPDCIGSLYDFWGRGNFGRMLLNTRCFENSFNVTIEVRSLDDVKRAIRLWGLYADFLILLWKGVTKNGLSIIPFPEDYEDPGGWGYLIAAGSVVKIRGSKKKWYPAMAHISGVPDDVAAFLASEARPFLESGRLILVPAVGAGCVNPGHGPFEQLLAEAANAIPTIRWKGLKGTPIGFIPHSPNAPFKLLADLAEDEADRLRKLRLLLLKRSRELRPESEMGLEAKTLSLEIDDALRDLQDRTDAVARRKGLKKAKEPVTGATARFKVGGRKLTTESADSPFAPLLILQNLGYGWRVDSPDIPRFPPRFEPQEGDIIGAWLAPPSAGWAIPTIQARMPSD